MRYTASYKLKTIIPVEQSHLSAQRTLEKFGALCTTFTLREGQNISGFDKIAGRWIAHASHYRAER